MIAVILKVSIVHNQARREGGGGQGGKGGGGGGGGGKGGYSPEARRQIGARQ